MNEIHNTCGSKPTCLGWSEGCKIKQREYYNCVNKSGDNQTIKFSVKYLVIGLVAVALVVVFAKLLKTKI